MRAACPVGLMVLLLLTSACGGADRPVSTAPDLELLKNMTYPNIENEPITLADGAWEGAPFVEGSPLRPTVNFVGDFFLTGDLDGSGSEEAVVLLEHATGGTGRQAILAVTGIRDGEPACLTTTRLGDRVKLVNGRLVAGVVPRVELELLQAGPGDGACCPRDLVTRAWAFDGTDLAEIETGVTTRRVSRDALAGVTWVLRRWSWDDAAPTEPEVTLEYADGRFSGTNGCNNYFIAVEETEPTKITMGPGGATKMYCPDPAGAIEQRFDRTMAAVTDYGFMGGQLILMYEVDENFGVMFFERRETEGKK